MRNHPYTAHPKTSVQRDTCQYFYIPTGKTARRGESTCRGGWANACLLPASCEAVRETVVVLLFY